MKSILRGRRIGVCLSGGGFRAALFHLGALRRLNEAGLLSRVSTFSSVSGGSILNAALAVAWPELERDRSGVFLNFRELVEQPVRSLCSRDIRTWPLLWGRLVPWNWWGFAFRGESATTLLAREYDRHLLHGARLGLLSLLARRAGPTFVLCAACLETGVNFELGSHRVGDYKVGYTQARDLPLADAVAASSSFPAAFPPYTFDLAGRRMRGGSLRFGPGGPPVRKLLLTDGGVYDNLGLEPVWKTHDVIFVSDAGAAFQTWQGVFPSFIARLLRTQKVVQNQARAVRKRWLMEGYNAGRFAGAYWGLGTDIAGYATGVHGYRGETLQAICSVRTDLNRFAEGEQLVLMNHGWQLARAALRRHAAGAPDPAGAPPSPPLLSPAAALRALRR